ncbi:hypothetical protein Tco_0074385, partial [Tanacetum coccineum]
MTTSKLPSLTGMRSISKVSSVIGGILSLEARDMDTKLLSASESNNTLARCWFRRNVPVTTFRSWHDKLLIGCKLLLVVGPLFLQFLGAFLTHGKDSSIPTIFSWGGSISPDSFLPSILLLLVIDSSI